MLKQSLWFHQVFSVASSIRVSRKPQFQYLQEHGGYCDLGDKSDAEEIKTSLRDEQEKHQEGH